MNENILEIKDIHVNYKSANLAKNQITNAVRGVSLNIIQGETFAIAGESGCGKSTLAKAITKLVPYISGNILFYGKAISGFSKQELKEYKKNVQMIFQNPYSSLNPKMTIRQILEEPLIIHSKLSKAEISSKIETIIEKVELNKSHLELYPHEFSGGQRQRIAIARALILEPKLIIADEPVSALDASIQAQILNLLNDLKKEYNLTIIFISHDLSVIRFIADKIGIMYLGELVETGTKEEIFTNPLHPYTKMLLNSIPSFEKKSKEPLNEDNSTTASQGCSFAPRCSDKQDKCFSETADFIKITDTHFVKCCKYLH